MNFPMSVCVLRRALSSGRKIAQAITLLVWAASVGIGSAAAQSGNVTIAITSPKSQETIHDNTGKVPVKVAISNNGALAAGTVIRALLDGRPHGPPQDSTSFVLQNVDRGEHTLQVQLLDAAGNSVASSDSVTFYLWQASALFPGRS